MTIRELRPDDDLAAVLQLCKDFFAEYESHHEEFFDTDSLTDADISGRFQESLTSEKSATIVAVVEDKIVGYVSLAIREQPRFYKIKTVGTISALMVAPELRRRGIGTQLLIEAGNYFGDRGVKYFTFCTSVANTGAIKLYERLGMIPLHTVFLGNT
ncbi:MAG: GNAT family N-acetyltransferase [candidate division Zixibacteria bacterium]|nr:GNAT family N-acetyltransferase [candidate division Zixibacteria bacterium]